MSKDGESNGGNGVEITTVDTVVLTYDRVRDHLQVGGKCNSFDLMLDILGRATRIVEQKLRMQAAIELQGQLRQEAEDAAIAAALRKG